MADVQGFEPEADLTEGIDTEEYEKNLNEELEDAGDEPFDPTPKETWTSEKEPELAKKAKDEKPKKADSTKDNGEPSYLKDLPPEVRSHVHGIKQEMLRLREEARSEKSASEERTRMMFEQVSAMLKPQKEAAPPPDQNEDPEAYQRYVEAKRDKEIETLKQKVVSQEQQTQRSQEQNKVLQKWQAHAASFKVEHSDFDEAYQAAAQYKLKAIALEKGNWSKSAQELNEILIERELDLVQEVIAAGKDPAEMTYQFAKSIGYKAAGEPDSETQEKPKKSEAESQAKTIMKGQNAAKNPGKTSGGKTEPDELTPESISAIRDPVKFQKTYKAWLAKELGHSADFME